jgi:hypothetical protein
MCTKLKRWRIWNHDLNFKFWHVSLILIITQTCWCVFTLLSQCHLELERVKRLSSFYLGHFSLSKSFNHIIKNTNVHHLNVESSNSCKLCYFPISTLSRYTSHHHDRSIASCWFLRYKYGQLITWKDFHTYFELTWCVF